MKKKNATIKGKHVSIYLHNIDKGYNYYAIYEKGHRLGQDENGKLLNYTIDQLKKLSEILYDKKRIRLDAWPRKNECAKFGNRPFEMIFEIGWTNQLGEIETSIYKSKHCKLKYAKRKLNELYKYYAGRYNVRQAHVYEYHKIVYSKLQEIQK